MRSHSSRSYTSPKGRLALETLGERVMPASGIFRSSLGIVTIEGTAGDDVSQVSVSGRDVTVTLNSQTSTFALGKVKGLVFKGLNGDDSFTNNTNFASTAFGGNGDDSLTGGNATDLFFGGAGDDTLNGNNGNDTLNGELGDDRLLGRSGNDLVRGGAGNDDLQGGSGNDSLSGDDGDDHCNGDSGIDRISGGRGSDRTIRDSRDRSDDSEQIEGFQQVDGLAKVEGTISAIDGDAVTIRTRSGLDVQFTITATTVLEKNGVHVTLSSFAVGDPAEAKFDAVTRNAFKLESGEDGEDNGGGNQAGQSKIEGTITAVGSDSVSIRLQNGTIVTVLVNGNTKIERNDLHVPLSAFQVGDRGEARYDATSMIASKVEAVG
jgi:hypothetical protein